LVLFAPMFWQTSRFGSGVTSLRDVSLAEARG